MNTLYTIADFSCIKDFKDFYIGYFIVERWHANLTICLGDNNYPDAGESVPGKGRGNLSRTEAVGGYKTWDTGPAGVAAGYGDVYETLFDNPGFSYLAASCVVRLLLDDHEIGNDWDNTIANIHNFDDPKTGFIPDVTLQSEVDQIYIDAITQYKIRANLPLPNLDDLADPDQSREQGDDVDRIPLYCKEYVAGGRIKLIYLDTVSYRTDREQYGVDADNGQLITDFPLTAKTLLGAVQLIWFEGEIDEVDGSLFTIVMSSKITYKGETTSENNGWSNCPTERDYVVDFCKASPKSILFRCGDVHAMSIINDVTGHACINSSPGGISDRAATRGFVNLGTRPYTDNYVWSNQLDQPTPYRLNEKNGYGITRLVQYPSGLHALECYLLSDMDELLWTGRMMEGAKFLTNGGGL